MSARALPFVLALSLILMPRSLAEAQQGDTPDKVAPAEQAPPGHQERPHDEYVPVPPGTQAVTPAVRWVHGRYESVQVNVDANGNNIVGDAANEPTIAVDPTNAHRIVIGWRQFDTINSDFRQAGWGYSHDGGLSWTFPGKLEPGVFRSDPVLAADLNGTFFYNSLTSDGSGYWCKVFNSYDGGVTFQPGVYAYGGDKQWMTIDRTLGIGSGNIYAYWTEWYSICAGQFTRSYNGGASYLPCTYIPGSPNWGVLDVGPDGELYVCGDGFVVAKSTTMKDPNQPANWQLSTTVNLGGSLVYGVGPNPGGLLGQAWLAVNHSNGPQRGHVYLLASVDPTGADPLDIRFSRSVDGGQTWSSSVRVNDDPTNNGAWQWFGTMSVAPNGRIDVIWNDTRNHPASYLSELFYTYSTDEGVTWAPNEQLTIAWDPHIGWPIQQKIGDYYHMISDDRGADLAFAATFNGEEDVYYMRIGEPKCSDAGTLELDRSAYKCDGTVGITLNDCGMNLDPNAVESAQVTLASTSEPGGEPVVLTETGTATALFDGSIVLSTTDGPGVLLVAPGDTLTATYIDADDGEGHQNVVVTVNAAVDCVPPTITAVESYNITAHSAKVRFTPNEFVRGTVRYGLACDDLTDSVSTSTYTNWPIMNLTDLDDGATYYYAVEAEDQAGNITLNDNGGYCFWFETPDVPEYFAQLFSGDNDLDYKSLVFTPNGSLDYYYACNELITQLPTDPAGGTPLTLTNDSSVQVTLGGGAMVSLYGVAYTRFFVGSNGYITFNTGDSTSSESYANHFNQPRVSALFDDLNPATNTVSWKQLADRAVVTWLNVTEYGSSTPNTFQIELYFDGQIKINYLAIAATDGLAGLSPGGGVPADFTAADLTALGPCRTFPPTAHPASVDVNENTTVLIALSASDDGLPNPPGALTYVIMDLPEHGHLWEPDGPMITTVPHVLTTGHSVTYRARTYYRGPDSFLFLANDGGTPPDGGDSNTATIAITVVGVPERVYNFPLDTNPGWSTEGAWAFGHPTGGGSYNRDPNNGHTGTNVYGYNLSGNYTNNMPARYLTTTALDCSDVSNVELRFWRWLGVEQYDGAAIEVSNNGATWNTVWVRPGTISEAAWSQQTYSLAATADHQATVYVRWSMGPSDVSVTYPGWNIDDVEIWGLLPHGWLKGDMNCDGAVDFGDINPFVKVLTNPAGYDEQFPNCDPLNADVDLDGQVGFTDINPFVSLLSGGR